MAERSRRSPYGERGLKSLTVRGISACFLSLPVWGAWIEIRYSLTLSAVGVVAPRMGSVD